MVYFIGTVFNENPQKLVIALLPLDLRVSGSNPDIRNDVAQLVRA